MMSPKVKIVSMMKKPRKDLKSKCSAKSYTYSQKLALITSLFLIYF